MSGLVALSECNCAPLLSLPLPLLLLLLPLPPLLLLLLFLSSSFALNCCVTYKQSSKGDSLSLSLARWQARPRPPARSWVIFDCQLQVANLEKLFIATAFIHGRRRIDLASSLAIVPSRQPVGSFVHAHTRTHIHTLVCLGGAAPAWRGPVLANSSSRRRRGSLRPITQATAAAAADVGSSRPGGRPGARRPAASQSTGAKLCDSALESSRWPCPLASGRQPGGPGTIDLPHVATLLHRYASLSLSPRRCRRRLCRRRRRRCCCRLCRACRSALRERVSLTELFR
jgi:hypothetical protein